MAKYSKILFFLFSFIFFFHQKAFFLSALEDKRDASEESDLFSSPFHDLCGVPLMVCGAPLIGNDLGQIYKIVRGALYGDQETKEEGNTPSKEN